MRKLILLASFSGLLAVVPVSASLVVTETTTPSGGFYNYSYSISESGTSAAYTDFLLTSADISPTNVTLNFDGGGAGAWTWYEYSTTQIDFFNNLSGTLNLGDTLVIGFRSDLPPGAQSLQGFNVNGGSSSNVVSTNGPTATPEPASFGFLAIGVGILAMGAIRRMGARV